MTYDVVITCDGSGPSSLERASAFAGALFVVKGQSELTHTHITLDGMRGASTGSLVEVSEQSTVVIADGATLRNNLKTVSNGAGICVIENSTLSIEPGSIIEENEVASATIK